MARKLCLRARARWAGDGGGLKAKWEQASRQAKWGQASSRGRRAQMGARRWAQMGAGLMARKLCLRARGRGQMGAGLKSGQKSADGAGQMGAGLKSRGQMGARRWAQMGAGLKSRGQMGASLKSGQMRRWGHADGGRPKGAMGAGDGGGPKVGIGQMGANGGRPHGTQMGAGLMARKLCLRAMGDGGRPKFGPNGDQMGAGLTSGQKRADAEGGDRPQGRKKFGSDRMRTLSRAMAFLSVCLCPLKFVLEHSGKQTLFVV